MNRKEIITPEELFEMKIRKAIRDLDKAREKRETKTKKKLPKIHI